MYLPEAATQRADVCLRRRPTRIHIIEPRQALPPPPLAGADVGWALFVAAEGGALDAEAKGSDTPADARLHNALKWMHSRLDGALALLSTNTLESLDTRFAWHERAAIAQRGAQLRTATGAEITPGRTDADAAARASSAPVVALSAAGSSLEQAVATLMRAAPFAGRKPWIIGVNAAVEPLFRGVNAAGGVSVIVGHRRPTAAHYALPDPAAVRAWLQQLAWS